MIISSLLACNIILGADIYETIFEGNCGSCHTLKDNSSAPLVTEVIKRYKNKYPKEKEFVNALSNWVFSPSSKNSLFPEAIKYHGLMPELDIDKDTLKGIARYLYRQYYE